MSLAAMREDAYVAVLRAFHAKKGIDWSHTQLLRSLREGLCISQDQHIACLGIVIGDHANEKETHTAQPDRVKPRAESSTTGEVKRRAIPSKLDKEKKIKKQKVKGREIERVGLKGSEVTHGADERGRYWTLTEELMHGVDESGLNYLYGHELETYWEESSQEGKWYSALVTDYNPSRREHKLSYDQGSLNETFEWVELDEEVKKGNVRLPAKEKLIGFQIGRSEKCGDAPFDDNVFEKMLKEGTKEELQWMLARVQSRSFHLCSHVKPPKNPSTQEEAIVGKLIARGQLLAGKRKEMKILL